MSILAFIEQRNGQIRPVSREALGEASRIAEKLGGPVVGVCPAASDPGLAALGEAGATRVLLARHEAFAQYDAAGYARAVAAAVEAVKPALLLFGASAMGKDLAPRVAARLGVGLATDCTALSAEGGKLVATRPVYAGKANLRVSFPKVPAIASEATPDVLCPACDGELHIHEGESPASSCSICHATGRVTQVVFDEYVAAHPNCAAARQLAAKRGSAV